MMIQKQQIDARQYKGETHTVTTDDGYVLTLFRIVPAKLPAPAVILQHGHIASSDCWVTDNAALSFKLSDAGYDVWLSNARGNCYSRNHTKLNPDKDKSFWNFSFHEMGTKDIPAVIDYILNTTGQEKLHYVGHSMGTTMAFVMGALRPEYNNKLKSLVALSPIVFVSLMTELMGRDRLGEGFVNKFINHVKATDKWEVCPRKDLYINKKTQVYCEDLEEVLQDGCKNLLEMTHEFLGGAYFPHGQSVKTQLHFHQMAVEGNLKFFKYDTPEENEKIYGSKEPPGYLEHFKNIKAPTILWSSVSDGLFLPKDVDKLKPLMGNVIADNRIPDWCFDHMTFAVPWKVDCLPAREKFYKDLIETLKKLD